MLVQKRYYSSGMQRCTVSTHRYADCVLKYPSAELHKILSDRYSSIFTTSVSEYFCGASEWSRKKYEGVSINNQPIPFPMDRDDFHALIQGVLLQQDNARVHTCKVAMDAVERNGYELIPHPAYSSDLAPSDFFLFPNLKKDIRGLHFRSDEEVVTAVEQWVSGKDPDFFSSGLMALEHRWSKCITLEGNCIEKEEVDLNRK